MNKKLSIAEPRGFCAGVVRAIDIVDKALDLWGAPIFVKHEIVHNWHVVNRLKERGAIFVEDLNTVPKGSKIIYSAHGVSPAVRALAKERELHEIDATCPLVTKIHSAVVRYAKKGYHILLIGHKNHVEVIGTAGEAPERTTVVETVEDVEKLPFNTEDKLFYTTQTTLSLDDVQEITDAILKKYPQIETLPSASICYATTNRQHALREISKDCDLIIVVGDTQSSNSNRLKEVGERRGIRSFLVNHPDDIDPDWLKEAKCIGLSAGASTPEEIVQKITQRLEALGVNQISNYTHTEEEVFFSLPKELQEGAV